MISTLIAVAVAAAFALPMAASAANDSGAAQASTGRAAGGANDPSGTGTRFDQLDANHDGYLSRDEGKDAEELNTRFSELDVNNDNKLSREEYNALNKSARSASGATGSKR